MTVIQPQSPYQWEQYFDLRFRILRQPWNESRGSERDPSDEDSTHLMLVTDDAVPVAVGRLHLNSADEAQVRFMAVDEPFQGTGNGSQLLRALEAEALRQGATRMMLEARENALAFYRRNGYTLTKKSYLLFGEIQHYTMHKQLEVRS